MSLELSRRALAVKPSSTLEITAKAKEMKLRGLDIIGFVAGEPDFKTPDNICEAAIRAINAGFTKYTPASGTEELKKAVSRKFKQENNLDYNTSQIVISNGGKHSLTNVFTAILNPGDEVIIPAPYWLSYPEIVKLSGGVPVFVNGKKEREYKINVEQLQKVTTAKTKAFILNSPNNPTGMIYTRGELEAIASYAVENDIYVVSDEIYENLIYGSHTHISIGALNQEIYKRTITVNGLAKSYAMTGWRIGYTGSSEELAKLMAAIQSHQTSNPNTIAQMAAVEALNGEQVTRREMTDAFDMRRKLIYRLVKEIPYLSALEPQGAFYLFVDVSKLLEKSYKGKSIGTAMQLAKILIEEFNVAVIPCTDFGSSDHMRLSYAISPEQIEKGIKRIAEFVKKLV